MMKAVLGSQYNEKLPKEFCGLDMLHQGHQWGFLDLVNHKEHDLRRCKGMFPEDLTSEISTYDEQTLFKVLNQMRLEGLSVEQAISLIHHLQNQGIQFRERV